MLELMMEHDDFQIFRAHLFGLSSLFVVVSPNDLSLPRWGYIQDELMREQLKSGKDRPGPTDHVPR
jgi:hypothetical protein